MSRFDHRREPTRAIQRDDGGIYRRRPSHPVGRSRRKDGLNVIYNLKDLKFTFIYSSVHTTQKP